MVRNRAFTFVALILRTILSMRRSALSDIKREA